MENKTFYPELSEQGQQEAIKLIESFKKHMSETADKVIGDLYCGVLPHIETDAWTNFKNQILNELCDYKNDTYIMDYDKIRKAIYKEHKEQIDKDLNQDLLREIESLKGTIKRMEENYLRTI